MPDGFIFTPGELQKLNYLLTREGRRRYGDPPGFGGPTPDDEEDSGAELYVARTPFEGLPALGFGTNTGTGTVGAEDDQPGHAECLLWRVLRTSPGVFQMDPIDSYPKDVLNLSTSAVDGDTWILVARDKFGEWFAITGGGGGGIDVCGTGASIGAATGTGTGTGTDADDCDTCVEDPVLHTDPRVLAFSCRFRVGERLDGDCGVSHHLGKTVDVDTRGWTGTFSFLIDVLWCASICDLVKWYGHVCVDHGLITHVSLDPPKVCP